MILSTSRFIPADIKVNGMHVPTAIQILQIMLSLIALPVMLMHIVGEIIQMLNVINAIPWNF